MEGPFRKLIGAGGKRMYWGRKILRNYFTPGDIYWAPQSTQCLHSEIEGCSLLAKCLFTASKVALIKELILGLIITCIRENLALSRQKISWFLQEMEQKKLSEYTRRVL